MSPHVNDRAYRRKRMIEDKQKRINKHNEEDNIKIPYTRDKRINPRNIEVENLDD